MPLTNSDPHHWSPVPEIVEHLAAKYKGKRVLEIGPGHVPFPAATHCVDWQDAAPVLFPMDVRKIDVNRQPLPYADLTFNSYEEWDFVYARHVLEDMWNPFHLIAEMSRVGKAGYIETPSPICELTRGVDGNSPPYCGYNHHRWLVWTGDGELRFISKFPYVEYLNFADNAVREQMLRSSARYWNTYHLWEGEMKVRHLQCPHDFAMPQDYGAMIINAMAQSKQETDTFYRTVLNVP